MKKGKIVIIIIWILLLLGIFIYSRKTKEPEIIEPEVIETEKETLDKYEYIDYTGLYDENDLKVEELYINDDKNYKYIKISGLKDKKIENQINEKLYDLTNKEKENGVKYIYSDVTLNAFNILSVNIISYNEERVYKTLNIDLTTGNEIKLEDILNSKNIIGPIANAYYDLASFEIAAQIKRLEVANKQIIAYNDNQEKIEENNNKISEYEELFKYVEDDSIKYARNFDKNQTFYITSAGIIFPKINVYDIKGEMNLFIKTKTNPRLFNFYYKYKTDESIYDGTYSGKKNLLLSEYFQYQMNNASSINKVEDYAIISNRKPEVLDRNLLDNFIQTLDKNVFTYIYNINLLEYSGNERVNLDYCTMTKEDYENEIKKELNDSILKSQNTQGTYSIKSEKAECYVLDIFTVNKNVMQDKITNEIIIINNEDKANEINDYIEKKREELKQQNYITSISIEEVTETKITISIDYYKQGEYSSKKIITETFDL